MAQENCVPSRRSSTWNGWRGDSVRALDQHARIIAVREQLANSAGPCQLGQRREVNDFRTTRLAAGRSSAGGVSRTARKGMARNALASQPRLAYRLPRGDFVEPGRYCSIAGQPYRPSSRRFTTSVPCPKRRRRIGCQGYSTLPRLCSPSLSGVRRAIPLEITSCPAATTACASRS